MNSDFLSYTVYSLCFLQLNHPCSPQPLRCFQCTHLCLACGTSTPPHVSAKICWINYALTCVKCYLKFAVITSCAYRASLFSDKYQAIFIAGRSKQKQKMSSSNYRLNSYIPQGIVLCTQFHVCGLRPEEVGMSLHLPATHSPTPSSHPSHYSDYCHYHLELV